MQPVATTLAPVSDAASSVSIESCLAFSTNPQVLTSTTSASEPSVVTRQPPAARRAARSSESTSLRAQPRVSNATRFSAGAVVELGSVDGTRRGYLPDVTVLARAVVGYLSVWSHVINATPPAAPAGSRRHRPRPHLTASHSRASSNFWILRSWRGYDHANFARSRNLRICEARCGRAGGGTLVVGGAAEVVQHLGEF